MTQNFFFLGCNFPHPGLKRMPTFPGTAMIVVIVVMGWAHPTPARCLQIQGLLESIWAYL
jgi:hypothetical protein